MLKAASGCNPLSHNPRMGTTARPASVMPSGSQLLSLESLARQQGTGLDATDLVGCWMLHQVWSKGNAAANGLSSALLRSLGARLVLAPSEVDGHLLIGNAINLGALQLRFSGQGRLIGKRPLLQFSFDSLMLSIGGQTLLQQSLPPVSARRLPFFALICRDDAGWLAARGRGGGLALWQLEPPS